MKTSLMLILLALSFSAVAQEGKIKKSTTFDSRSTKQPKKAEKATAEAATKSMPSKTGVNTGGQKQTVSQADLETMSPKRKEYVLAHPELYTVTK